MGDLYIWKCRCGETNAMTKELERLLRRTQQTFYCVHGHDGYFPKGETEEDKVRRERDRLKQENARLAEMNDGLSKTASRFRDEAEHQRRRANGYKGHAAKITKRAKNGVCPCCNRTFQNLRRHMATKHPQFTPDCPEPLRVVEGGKK